MIIKNTKTPVVVLGCNIGALSIARSLGPLGVPVYGIDGNPYAPTLRSRYFRRTFIKAFNHERPGEYLQFVLQLGRRLGRPTILIPTSDEIAEWMADHREELQDHFVFQDNPPKLVQQLASKKEMFALAHRIGIPTPNTLFPKSIEDVRNMIERLSFPVMLKGIYGNRLAAQTGKKMVIVRSAKELLENYQRLEEPENPNLMFQELIPGDDDQVFIFNGYFNAESDCLAAFTGRKIRQCPIHVGCASLGECRWYPEVAEQTQRFMKEISYNGILDIGYRLDPRDGLFKVLDVNPRVGQAFRIFVDHDGVDVIRALYMDFTGQQVPAICPREGRRWIIEDYDFIHSVPFYYLEGSLGFWEWLNSFRGLEEAAWFDWKDPLPFFKLFMDDYVKGVSRWLNRKFSSVTAKAQTVFPAK